MNACIKYGWCKKKEDQLPAGSEPKYPESGWCSFTSTYRQEDSCPDFSMSQIVAYFVTRTVKDSLPAGDFKSVNRSAENLFRCGHIQRIECVPEGDILYVRSNCLPEMRKDRVYCVKIALQSSSFDIIGAECGCPAGHGPNGSCKHIGALSYALADFIRFRASPDYQTCTDVLQQWNRPRSRRVEPIPVDQLGDRRRELLPSKIRAKGSKMVFDPRPLHLRQPDPEAIEKLRCDLLAINKPCAFLNIIVPSVEKVLHDHTYSSQSGSKPVRTESIYTGNSGKLTVSEKSRGAEDILQDLCLDTDERQVLEENTRAQSSCPLWFEARQHRITGSKCGRIVEQKQKTQALLRFVMYPKPMLYLPKPIRWGKDHEEDARQAYLKYMHNHGHNDIEVKEAGFIVHETKGWLGASPDGWVEDRSHNPPNGILEIKCPFSMANKTPKDMSEDENSFIQFVENSYQLNKGHQYYHQVQLQLFVTSDRAKWCDFCVFTLKGVCVQRIFPDSHWVRNTCPKLDDYFFEHMLPELVCPKYKPSYYL